MPKHVSKWCPDFLQKCALFDYFEPWARELRGVDWPRPELITQLAETPLLEAQVSGPELERLRFVDHELLNEKRKAEGAAGLSYDAHITLDGIVPFRFQNYHDLFGALVFCAFPSSKRSLHARQTEAQIRRTQIANRSGKRLTNRGRDEDALTVLDEFSALVVMTPEAEKNWRMSGMRISLTTPEARERGIHVLLFGHGLLDRLQQGERSLRVSALFIALALATPVHTERLMRATDLRLSQRIKDSLEFQRPGADLIVHVEDGGASIQLGPPKPSWTERESEPTH